MGYQPPLTQDVTSVEGASATTLVATSNVESIITANTTVAGALQKANNLSDVTTKGTGRFNIRVPILAGVQAAATANVNIASAPASVDGYSFVSSGLDTVLLTAQSTPSQNGTWVWNGTSSALTRPADWPAAGAVTTGRIVQVQNGTVNANTLWMIDVPSTGITIDTTAQTWVSLNILGNTVNESVIRANTLNQMGAPTAAINMNSQNFTNLEPAIVAAQAPTVGQLAGTQIAYVVSGCTWTPDAAGSTRLASMTAGTVMIKGILLTVAAISGHTFLANDDTYVDFTDNGDGTAAVTYSPVANNGPSPALAGTSPADTLRNAIITAGASSIGAQSNINQGDPAAATPPTAITGTTVAAGSNGNSIATSTLSVAANSFPAAGIAQVDTSNGSGLFFGALIAYTGGGGTTTLTGVTVLSERTGTGTVATGGVVSSWARYNVTDSLGNFINPTSPYPTCIGFKTKSNSGTTTGTTEKPINTLYCPFVIPPGPSRRVRIWASVFVASSAVAGTAIAVNTAYGNQTGNSFTDIGFGTANVAVTTDGLQVNPAGEVFLPPGSYVGLVRVVQGAAGTLTVGAAGATAVIGVDLVG